VNHAVVGAFVLALGSMMVALALWLAAGGALQKNHEIYLAWSDESVSGLNVDAPVKLNGVDVGHVRSIVLDPANPKRVRLLFAIERGTPIRSDTVAMLRTQGLTGIAYVELSGGSLQAGPLRASGSEPYPVIPTRPSLGARLENVLGSALSKLDRTSDNIDAVLSDANRAALTSALTDIAAVARTLAARNDTLDQGLADAARTFDHAARASAQVGPLIERLARSAEAVEKLGVEGALASRSAAEVIGRAGGDVQRLTGEALPELQRLAVDLQALSGALQRLTEQTERDPAGPLFGRSPPTAGPGESPASAGPR
jgi:phospholipid/cholesterol/gamma-HCH transport system substrate-binding protein